MTRVQLGDIEVNYCRRGEGPPVVLLHGLAEDCKSWDRVADRLDGFTVYAVDLRGHGATTAGSCEGTLEQLAGDLAAFQREVSGPGSVVGYSLGGAIGLWAATRPDSLIGRLVVVATSSVVGRAAADFFAGRIAQISSGDWAGFAQGLRSDTAQQVVSEADIDALAAARLAAVGTGDGYVNAARAMIGVRSSPLHPRLESVAIPVDVIGADRDMFCPRRASELIVEALPDARYHEIGDAGHLVSIDQPQRYGELIARVLKGTNI